MSAPTPQAVRDATEAGMARAYMHANTVDPGWGDRALAHLAAFMAEHQEPFTTMRVRQWAGARGFVGITNWAWGSVMVQAQRAGLIRKAGVAVVGDTTSHLKPATLWVKA